MSKKRLFALRNMKSGKLYKIRSKLVTFPVKASAKTMRKSLNGTYDEDGQEVMHYTVTYGPDHKRYIK
jgi:hypothetical protein